MVLPPVLVTAGLITLALASGGPLIDVGKLGIPDAILHKRGPLNGDEWDLMKTHPEIGLRILRRSGHFKRELQAVLYHHERMDGSGYPHGLAGDAIPVEARIVAVADTYDVLTSDRPYRAARSTAEARRVIVEQSGGHLDPRLVAALLHVLDRENTESEARPAADRPVLRQATAERLG